MKQDMLWRFAWASVLGTSHVVQGIDCQDASNCVEFRSQAGSTLVLVCSDGAGTASRAAQGSQAVCQAVSNAAQTFADSGCSSGDFSTEILKSWFEQARTALVTLADFEGLPLREFACTLLLAVVFSDRAFVGQLGDGAVVIGAGAGDELELAVWPMEGEYVNSTFFLTQNDWLEYAYIVEVEPPFSVVALFTDGIQRMALNYATRSVHVPFFQSMFRRLFGEPPGASSAVNSDLSRFLSSEPVNSRTDDDKTLILAVRGPDSLVQSNFE
jgi:hypothetical protein